MRRGWGVPSGAIVLALSLVTVSLPGVAQVQSARNATREESPARTLGIEGRRLSLFQAVAISIDRNRRMISAGLSIREREHQRRETFSDFFPRLDFQYTARASRYSDPGSIYNLGRAHDARRFAAVTSEGGFLTTTTFSEYPYRIDPYRFFSATATLTQPIFTAGRSLNQYKYSRLGVDYAAIQLEVDRQDLILEVYEAYYNMMRGYKQLEVANQSVMALEALRKRAQAFYDAKALPKVDVLSTEGQLSEARKRQTQSRQLIGDSRDSLNYLMRLPLDTPIDIVFDYEFRPAPYRVPDVFTIAAANRLELRQANISVQQAIALVESAKGALWPSVYLELRGARSNDDWNIFDQEGINDWMITGAFVWNFDTFRSRETIQERRASTAKAQTERDQLVDTIFREVSRTYRKMKRTESDIQNNRKAVEHRREAFRVARERYNGLLATYTEVLDAERQLHQSLGELYDSLIDYRLDQATLERQMGILRN